MNSGILLKSPGKVWEFAGYPVKSNRVSVLWLQGIGEGTNLSIKQVSHTVMNIVNQWSSQTAQFTTSTSGPHRQHSYP